MGKNIYGDCKLGLRELVQNSIDACELMKERKNSVEEFIPDPQISIILSKKNNYVKIKDSGIGMTLNVVKKHFLNVGKSYYKSNEYYYENFNYKPIGQYGIGFLACFLLSDNVIVKTKYYDSSEICQIELEKNSEYVVTNTEETGSFIGTEIILDYDSFFSVFHNKTELVRFLERYFFTSIPINIRDTDNSKDTIEIKNNCKKLINSKVEKENEVAFDTIDCEKYSDEFKGTLIVRKAPPENSQSVHKITNNEKYYILNMERKQFEAFDPDCLSLDGCYFIIEYSIISNPDTYPRIVKSNRSFYSRRDAILSEGEKAYLMLSGKESIGFFENRPTINDIDVRELIKNSGLDYYEELISDFEYLKHIYLKSNQYIFLERCAIGGPSYFEEDAHNNLPLYFYNKGVWISRMNRAVCLLPYGLSGMGVINYIGDNVKLDVSRNSIIDGRREIVMQLTNIILKHKLNIDTDSLWNKMINHLIQYNNEQIEKERSKKDEKNPNTKKWIGIIE